MLGNVFSPYYAKARSRGDADPFAHCTMNVALYGPAARWSLTERGRASLVRESASLAIGASSMRFAGGILELGIEEFSSPFRRPLRGTVRVHLPHLVQAPIDLDAHGRHRWSPIALHAPIEVELREPSLRFRGHAYLDQNWGDEPLEAGFRSWTWARATGPDTSVIGYVAEGRDGGRTRRLRSVTAAGVVHEHAPLEPVAQGQGLWGVKRQGFSDDPSTLEHRVSWEDTPFYLRDLSEGSLLGARRTIVSETLDLDRFASSWVQFLLPFRMAKRDQG